jgi:HAD superfamily hydrolase (TIGR01509 family)
LVIFDCNGVLVDSEPIASAVLAEALTRAGIAVSADVVARRFHGRRPVDIFAAVEAATGKKLPPAFASVVAVETLRRFRTQLRALPHVVHALTWIRGPKAVASSSPLDRVQASLEIAGLRQFFGQRLFSASNVARGKPAPDVFEFAAARAQINPADCIVVEDSVSGVTAAVAAGMRAVGYVGGSQTPGRLARDLAAAGAHTAIADMRVLKGTIADLRGW